MKFFLPKTPDLGRASTLTLPGRAPKPVVRTEPRRGRDRGENLALTEIRGNLTFTASTVTAWFTAEEQPWAFRSDGEREGHIQATAGQYAALVGRRFHVRRTTTPFPVDEWAARRNASAQPLPDALPADLAGAERVVKIDSGWRNHVRNAADWIAGRDFAVSRTHIGIVLRKVRARDGSLAPALLDQIDDITETMTLPVGFKARPARTPDLVWMTYRSAGLGLTPPLHHPGDVGPDDIAEFTEAVEWRRGRFDATTELINRHTGESVHVAVLTVGRMGILEIPQVHEPWLHLSDQLGFPVEYSGRFRILGPDEARSDVGRRLQTIRYQMREYDDHDLDQPPDLARQADRAIVIGDQMDSGLPIVASRAHGWHRLAVYAPTRHECLARARELARAYDTDLAHTGLPRPRNQVNLLREFIPGQADANTGHLRRLPLPMLAAAVPQATGRVGDDRGDLIGTTELSGERPVFVDLHYPMEVRERSGVVVLIGEPGGGKSTLVGALGYLNARRGVQVTLMDPSGPLAQLCEMPELRPFSRVMNLPGSQAGTLAPYAMVPTPSRADFAPGAAGDGEYHDAVSVTEFERRALVLDITRMLLPALYQNDKELERALREAIDRVPAREDSTLNDVVDELRAAGTDAGSTAASLLMNVSGLPQGRLFFGQPPAGTLNSAPLTVITMAGLTLPNLKVGRDDWTIEEALAVPVLHMANRLAVRRCYSLPRHVRKMVGVDEAHFMRGWRSGAAFLDRLARDSRKWNIAAVVASQNPADILGLDMQNLVTGVFAGRIVEDAEIAAEALRLLRLPPGAGYERLLGNLSQGSTSTDDRLGYRQFVYRDVDGRVQTIRVDLSYIPDLLRVLNTTPGGTR